MSFESRLKESLERDALAVSPDVAGALGAVRRRHQSRRRVRTAAYTIAVAVVVAAAVVRGPRVLDSLRGERIAPAGRGHSDSNPAYARLSGVYTRRIADRPGAVRSYHLAGRWTMSLSEAGNIALTAPFGFTDFLGPPTESTFTLTGDRLLTKVMYHEGVGCTGAATYAWKLDRGALRLEIIGDDCPYRPTVLGSVWQRKAGAK